MNISSAVWAAFGPALPIRCIGGVWRPVTNSYRPLFEQARHAGRIDGQLVTDANLGALLNGASELGYSLEYHDDPRA